MKKIYYSVILSLAFSLFLVQTSWIVNLCQSCLMVIFGIQRLMRLKR